MEKGATGLGFGGGGASSPSYEGCGWPERVGSGWISRSSREKKELSFYFLKRMCWYSNFFIIVLFIIAQFQMTRQENTLIIYEGKLQKGNEYEGFLIGQCIC